MLRTATQSLIETWDTSGLSWEERASSRCTLSLDGSLWSFRKDMLVEGVASCGFGEILRGGKARLMLSARFETMRWDDIWVELGRQRCTLRRGRRFAFDVKIDGVERTFHHVRNESLSDPFDSSKRCTVSKRSFSPPKESAADGLFDTAVLLLGRHLSEWLSDEEVARARVRRIVCVRRALYARERERPRWEVKCTSCSTRRAIAKYIKIARDSGRRNTC